MERERSFERMPQRPPERQFQRENPFQSERDIVEYLRIPENQSEIVRYIAYIRALRAYVRQYALPQEQEVAHQIAHRMIETPALPPIAPSDEPSEQRQTAAPAPPPHTVLHVGKHMDVTLGASAAYQWPDRSQRELELTDGTTILPQTPIGIIDYYRNIERLNEDGSLIGFTRALVASATDSLKSLAREYQARQPQASLIEAFSGMSHLARLAKRFGFTTFDISDDRTRSHATAISRNIASRIATDNPDWEALQANYKPAQVAMISSPELLRRYSE